MEAAGVKTARAEQLRPGAGEDDIEAALDRFGPQFVVKDDGLAGGKGVVVTPDRAAARAHVEAVLAAGNPVLLESFLDGPWSCVKLSRAMVAGAGRLKMAMLTLLAFPYIRDHASVVRDVDYKGNVKLIRDDLDGITNVRKGMPCNPFANKG